MAVLSGCDSAELQDETRDETEEMIVTARTDLDELAELTPIAGQPEQVWWLRRPMGQQSDSNVPGPTDIMLEAIIDYGSAEAVTALLKGRSGTAVRLVGSPWYPDIMREATNGDERIPAEQYIKVDGFNRDARISVPTGGPGVVILHQVLG